MTTVKSSTRNLAVRTAAVSLTSGLFVLTAAVAQVPGATPEVCASALQNVQQICSSPTRNPKMGAILCTTAKLAYNSLHCNSAPPTDAADSSETNADPDDDDNGPNQ
jgi:hypothetical protein